MKEEHRINILLARKLAGEASPEELTELEALLLEFPGLHYAYTIVEDIQVLREGNGFTAAEEQHLLQEGLSNIDRLMATAEPAKERRMFPWKKVMGVAACIAVLVTAYSVWQHPRNQNLRNEVVTKNGSKTAVVLPDGTSVVLNACSHLRYDVTKFLNGDREVNLVGEAFFDVKHDPQHPFIIQTEHANIKVLGTVFNVKAYAEDATVEATLLSGKVEVSFPEKSASGGHKVVVLQPEQKLIIDKNNNTALPVKAANANNNSNYTITPVKVIQEGDAAINSPTTAWMNDRFDFDKITFEQLSHDLERWYNVTIRFKNDRYKNEVFSGAFRKQSIDGILQALQLTSGFHYEVNSKENVIDIW
ncbi:MAG: FecR domain-containing protein [Chitinophaga sp.]|uniref:FecR family protein n=1 Tax=Chitinophaga sp. TaxID=1869181 RepID=UPI001B1715E2|nr:FecR domain-containing protein [Chitinophaga sp.]MBO9728009.1 FecR domain-containing protein [Chitinophaga sp.]